MIHMVMADYWWWIIRLARRRSSPVRSATNV